MITRPLDLASKLRPEPRNFDFLFFVNGGLIVMFFLMFGSSFVLAPGLGVDFQLPQLAGARAGAARTTHRITVTPEELIYIDDGPADLPRLAAWLKEQAPKTKQPTLLIIANDRVRQGLMTDIYNAAWAAGFKIQVAAKEAAAAKP